MLTGPLLRVRTSRGRILPAYIDAADAGWLDLAESLRTLFRGREGSRRGELEQDLRELLGADPGHVVHRGLARLLEDRCEFEVASGQPPERIRELVFAKATARWSGGPRCDERAAAPPGIAAPFDRDAVLREVGNELGLPAEELDRSLFADLKSEQRLVRFRDLSAEHLLHRYNVALAQAVLLRSTRVTIEIRGEAPARLRRIFRAVKFHRLVCEAEPLGTDGCRLRLDGPLSLFSATQKYGLQLALFLPAVLPCRDFALAADLLWGPKRQPRTFALSAADGLVSHAPEPGTYVPPEAAMFADLFRRKVRAWDIAEAAEVRRLGDGFWVPDFRLTHRESGRVVFLELMGYWRRAGAEAHLGRLRGHAGVPFLVALSDELRVDDAGLQGLSESVYRFRRMPLPEEVARRATRLLETDGRPGQAAPREPSDPLA